MKDEALTTLPGLTKAEAAVNYLLNRIRVDADLRWYLLHTEAFARLCAAEAERTEQTPESVEAFFSQLAPHCSSDLPRLVLLRQAVRRLGERCHQGRLILEEIVAALDAMEE